MKTAFMYAGQGSQHTGMGTDFYMKSKAYREAVDQIGAGGGSILKNMMDNGPDDLLKMTENTQPAMAAFAIGVTEALKGAGVRPDVACGLSVGEYGALYAAGVITAGEYLDVVSCRGKAMADAAKGVGCAMSAVVGLDAGKVERAVQEASSCGYITVSNYNCAGQYVVCGDMEAVERCEEACRKEGALQCARLNVSGPFHTKYMESAADKLKGKLDEVELAKPRLPILLNVTGDYYHGEDLKGIMVSQVMNGIHFEGEIEKMLDDGVDVFIEIGPGKVLGKFVKKMAKAGKKDVQVFSVDRYEDIGILFATSSFFIIEKHPK